MTNEQEEKLAAMAKAQAANCCGASAIGKVGTARGYGENLAQSPEPARLRDRVREELRHAQIKARKAEQLMELEYLLDKHPDVARILELMHATGFGL